MFLLLEIFNPLKKGADNLSFTKSNITSDSSNDSAKNCGCNCNFILLFKYLLKHGCFIDTESVVFNKFKALDIGGFKTSYKFIVDYDFFIRFALKNDIYGSKEILSKWRIHEKQATNYMSLLELKELNYIYWK